MLRDIEKVVAAFLTRSLTLTFDKVVFTYSDLSYRRITNWFLAELSYRFKLCRPLAYPTHLQIEPSSICNLRCPVCHVVTDEGPRGFLAMEEYTRLLDEVGDSLLFLHFWGWGEPFLNDQFLAMVRLAHERGIQIITSTNGHFFDHEENVDRLIDSGLDTLIFALDGTDAATYEKYRRQGDFAKVCEGLRQLVKRKQERGAEKPVINLRMLVTRENESQVTAMRRFAEEVGVDLFTLKTLCSFDNESHGRHLLPAQSQYRRFRYDEEGEPMRIDNPCKKPWNHPTVYWDGTVVPCDYYNFRERPMGNAFRDGFRSVWFGKEFRELRRRLSGGETSEFRCGSCSLNYADVDRCVSHAFPISSYTVRQQEFTGR